MTPPDRCLAYLEALVQDANENAILLAESYIEELLQNSPEDRAGSARMLGDMQNNLLRRTEPSLLRGDVFDLLGNHILRLLEPDGST